MVLDDELLQREERDGLGSTEAYVMITQEDVVDGVACFMALYISSIPQSKVSWYGNLLQKC